MIPVPRSRLHRRALAVMGIFLALNAGGAMAQGRPTLNFYGVPGLIDMPSGEPARDGEFSWNGSSFAGMSRTALSFQITPRLGGTFRYTGLENWNFDGFSTYYDRNFDLRFQVLTEGKYRPSVTVGLQDFIGTGLFAAEYIAATKNLTPKLRVTAGLGWGRLGSYNSLSAPFGDRPPVTVAQGGKPNTSQWFRGPAAPFAGVEWQVSDRIGLKAEYSSDAYSNEAGQRGLFNRASPFNFGVEYQVGPALRVGAYSLYGSEVGVMLAFAVDPKARPRDLGIQGPAPLPVRPRPSRTAAPETYSQSWADAPDPAASLRPVLAQALASDGMRLDSLAVSGTTAQIRITNLRYDAEAQAIGRTARMLSQVLPNSVETFEIVPVADGMAASKVTIRRADLEALELAPDGSAQLQRRVTISDAGPLPANAFAPDRSGKRFNWSISPYRRLSFFDPSLPFRVDLGARFTARYDVAPGVELQGSLTQLVVGNIGSATRQSNSVLQHVRSDAVLYSREGETALETLTLAWNAHPARNIYTRVTAGYLERMFGGLSTEVLWKPVDGRLALGLELNAVQQRDYNQRFGFQDYGVITGHASAYYDLGKGYLVQVDVGRYLAGDYGATLTLDREFDNGWKVGAFATLTDVPFKDFGEGSFDKGIRITIPLAWAAGHPSRKLYSSTIRPLTRDGGARLEVDGRLFDTVRSYHKQGLDAQWGRVFR